MTTGKLASAKKPSHSKSTVNSSILKFYKADYNSDSHVIEAVLVYGGGGDFIGGGGDLTTTGGGGDFAGGGGDLATMGGGGDFAGGGGDFAGGGGD
ncbi:hypothetical protein AXG93_3522s1080 [Marchantia polymorpha subsp. ruderalis]|uniref:Uncharacterized protein n=1 Tax=Marchantia polymorpha subsp. ruderalis TaxID=1480154 RepID=A0A176WC53_MARPO|nr:hypothetical protein AXG93_3522s1080 [Marchantia polymorpha subsp. ruderalis]